jgi:multisubunit Na+/H+ antiporter MnhC subunit
VEILMSIVIGIIIMCGVYLILSKSGVAAFFLVLAYRAYQELGTDDMERMRKTEDH